MIIPDVRYYKGLRRLTLSTTYIPATEGKRPQTALALERAGCEVQVIGDEPDRIPATDWLLMWSKINSFPRIRRRLMSMPASKRPPVLIWHYENLLPPDASGLPWPRLHLREIAKILLRDPRACDPYTNYFVIRGLARRKIPEILVVTARNRQQFLGERGIGAKWSPIGYSEDMGRDLGLERDIDVLFLGANDVPRRNRMLDALERQGLKIVRGGSWSDPAFWGENRTRLLNRSKITINFARIAGELSGERLLLGMANKCLVISEPIYDPFPYLPGEHFVMTPPGEMAERIRYYLEHETERLRIVETAYPFALREMSIDRSVERVLQYIADWEKNADRSD